MKEILEMKRKMRGMMIKGGEGGTIISRDVSRKELGKR